ncbi:heavy-metal-associated domain-containing protein [Sabulilitoribacter arenilitoris]|uniref:Heavy-metal-associated domain-containing protein n=1 Tax=Wocania arenilitoris TaxID=2044858 RepID=A0AAE3EN96_9FLAO|nr:heavy-metal-associated domain-containing protein [Wocania arenilitoris]MCF7567587.1 heavy-metal-associated domain-containing protein [Wocania arenilitoris]
MKKIMILALMLIGTTTFAQNKNQKASLEVNGVCMMCKNRIEKACLVSKGVKFADWNVKTHELKLIYDARKTDLKIIQKTITGVGHDTKELKATDEAYAKVHPCCKYRDVDVVDDHTDEGRK